MSLLRKQTASSLEFTLAKPARSKLISTSLGFEDDDERNGNGGEEVSKAQLDTWKCNGVSCAEQGEFAEALAAWQKYLLIKPRDAVVLEMSAQAYLQTDQVLQALQAAELAAQQDDSWIPALHTLARCQREIGELFLSVATYERLKHLTKEMESPPTECEEIENELNEVRDLANQLTERRARYLESLESGALTSDQHEVCRCKYHLAARLPGQTPTETVEQKTEDNNIQ